jgi:hypothetical protein
LEEIALYLQNKFGEIVVSVEKSFFRTRMRAIDLARRLAEARVHDFGNPDAVFEPSEEEIRTERMWLHKPCLEMEAFYDGFKLQSVAGELLSEKESGLQHVHLIFTPRLFGTWDEMDHRYHARVCILGYPNLISTTGVIEAPAKPKEFYRLKREIGDAESKELFREKFIDYDDPRLTEVLKGYTMQGIFYFLTSEPFCGESCCRLFNSHWQDEIIRAQLEEPEFCVNHEKMLEDLRKKFFEM